MFIVPALVRCPTAVASSLAGALGQVRATIQKKKDNMVAMLKESKKLCQQKRKIKKEKLGTSTRGSITAEGSRREKGRDSTEPVTTAVPPRTGIISVFLVRMYEVGSRGGELSDHR